MRIDERGIRDNPFFVTHRDFFDLREMRVTLNRVKSELGQSLLVSIPRLIEEEGVVQLGEVGSDDFSEEENELLRSIIAAWQEQIDERMRPIKKGKFVEEIPDSINLEGGCLNV